MLNPIWLNTFKTLVDVGHFTRTAEVLNMTQPGVSQHIGKLETACGYPLIKRFNKQFELTVYGRKVYDYAAKLIQEEQYFLQELGQDEPFRGRCIIGCSGTLAWLLYPELLTLQQDHPDLTIEMESAPTDRILEQIHQGAIDIGLVTKSPSPKYFDSEVIGMESLVFVVPKSVDHKLSFSELLQTLGVIRHPDLDHYFLSYITHSQEPKITAIDIDSVSTRSYINQIHQILVPVAKGIGFTVVPKCCVNLFAERDKLRVLSIDEIKEPIYLVRKRNSILGKRYEAIINTIKDVLKES